MTDRTTMTGLRGYIEGYYGRLLGWDDRARILDRLHDLGMNAYLYAPKEDLFHRVHWRRPWNPDWIAGFEEFCGTARRLGIAVLGGIAPGLDYDPHDDAAEFRALHAKARQLVDAGAAGVTLMFDDIDEPPADGYGPDGLADHDLHANIATRLAAELDVPLSLVPRVYADEITDDPAAHYRGLSSGLPQNLKLFHCGTHIIAGPDPLGEDGLAGTHIAQDLVFWDNLYCNDYCPRRLFVGAYQGRDRLDEVMLNGTGLIETDLLLLSVMAAGSDVVAWHSALAAAGVPQDFRQLAPWFDHPVANDQVPPPPAAPTDATFAAIEALLWRWKTPLAREWYPFLFGLKHDLLLSTGNLPGLRVHKTQTAALAQHLGIGPAGRNDQGNG
ncbi:MAG: beta-N-acetylglucosaminidase domain-containing protein [Pseudomonadota bacterium]|nr:beta-N-acetylglucosaminidase domain-containing protein [Pseudomonadota bacterium]